MQAWRRLGTPAPDALTDARLQLHWAAQVVAAVGNTYLTPRTDDSHPNMEWLSQRDWLLGNVTETAPAFRAALHVPTLTLVLASPAGDRLAAHELDGQTVDEAYVWLRTSIAQETAGALDRDLIRPPYDIPQHAVGGGAPFAMNGDAFAELARWYGNADLILRAVTDAHQHAAPVRVWPHHFDIGTVLYLDPDARGEEAPSIGLGMTPGDHSYPEPYWYVNPWPRPELDRWPALIPEAHWHSSGWVGAVLTGPATVAPQSAEEQRALVERYVAAAIEGNRSILLEGA